MCLYITIRNQYVLNLRYHTIMKKFEKGILGYRKDPKNQFLFTFTARKGEEWPSDSEDSDYEPTKEEAKEINIKVKKKKKNRFDYFKDQN